MSNSCNFTALDKIAGDIEKMSKRYLRYEEAACLILYLIDKDGSCSLGTVKEYLENGQLIVSDTVFNSFRKTLIDSNIGHIKSEKVSKGGRGRPRSVIYLLNNNFLANPSVQTLIKYWEQNYTPLKKASN